MSTSELTIDLSQPVFEIKLQESEDQKDTIIDASELEKGINFYFLGIGGILLIGSFGYLLYFMNQYYLTQTTKLQKKIEKILRKYGDIIITLQEEPNIKIDSIIEVKELEELIHMEEEIREPILFYNTKKSGAVFMIISQNIIYRVILKED